MRYYQTFITVDQWHWATYLNQLVDRPYHGVEIPLELATVDGKGFIPDHPGGSVGRWLDGKGVNVWYFNNPFMVVDLGKVSGRTDRHWFRKRQYEEALHNGWFMRHRGGRVTIEYSYTGPGGTAKVDTHYMIDPRIPEYREWYVRNLPEEARRIRWDVVPFHWAGYVKQDIDQDDVADGVCALADEIRSGGRKLIGNWSWQPRDPNMSASWWDYPYMDHMDGAMIELPTGTFWEGTWYDLAGGPVHEVLTSWRSAGKDVILFARWDDIMRRRGFGQYEQFAKHWHDVAKESGAWYATGSDVGGENATHNPKWFSWYEPGDDSGAEELRKEVAALSERVAKIEAWADGIDRVVQLLGRVMDAWKSG
ncbi:MAG: hypothetical protein GY753_12795 [Gammaproteobacteria bacterium]|nr:hypothetical protein [Gammaproteobacteria bacterium]